MAAFALFPMTEERVREILREELAKALGGAGYVLVPLPEAARRLRTSLRTVQRRVKDGSLEVEPVGGIPHVRLPAALAAG